MEKQAGSDSLVTGQARQLRLYLRGCADGCPYLEWDSGGIPHAWRCKHRKSRGKTILSGPHDPKPLRDAFPIWCPLARALRLTETQEEANLLHNLTELDAI